MKKCFTINCMRTKADFIEYEKLINEGLFQGVELFFPYNVSLEQRETIYPFSRRAKRIMAASACIYFTFRSP